MPRFSITITERDGTERAQRFHQDGVTVGRARDNDLVLPRSNVSKRHARISASGQSCVVADLLSTNGVYVNDERIDGEMQVSPGDRVYIGDFMLSVGAEAPVEAGSQVPGPPEQRPGESAESASGVAMGDAVDRSCGATRVQGMSEPRTGPAGLSAETETAGGAEFGPLLEELRDSSVDEIRLWGAAPEEGWVIRHGGSSRLRRPFASADAYQEVLSALLGDDGRQNSGPMVQREPIFGFCITALKLGEAVLIRLVRGEIRPQSRDAWLRRGAVSEPLLAFLVGVLRGRANLLISSKDEVSARELASLLASEAGLQRVLAAPSDVPSHPPFWPLAVGEGTTESLKFAAGFGVPLFAQMAGEGGAGILRRASTDLDGVIGWTPGRSIRSSLSSLAVSLTSHGLQLVAATELIAAAFDVVVQLERSPDGHPALSRVEAVQGQFAGETARLPLFARRQGEIAASGQVPVELCALLASRGVDLDESAFVPRS